MDFEWKKWLEGRPGIFWNTNIPRWWELGCLFLRLILKNDQKRLCFCSSKNDDWWDILRFNICYSRVQSSVIRVQIVIPSFRVGFPHIFHRCSIGFPHIKTTGLPWFSRWGWRPGEILRSRSDRRGRWISGIWPWDFWPTEPVVNDKWITGWWFGTFYIFPYIGNNHPNWLILFRGVQTTNQICWSIH